MRTREQIVKGSVDAINSRGEEAREGSLPAHSKPIQAYCEKESCRFAGM